MADEVEEPKEQETTVEVSAAAGEVSVEVEPERRRPAIDDGELAKMTAVSDDEISRANKEARQAR
jgi:hypothetical protein